MPLCPPPRVGMDLHHCPLLGLWWPLCSGAVGVVAGAAEWCLRLWSGGAWVVVVMASMLWSCRGCCWSCRVVLASLVQWCLCGLLIPFPPMACWESPNGLLGIPPWPGLTSGGPVAPQKRGLESYLLPDIKPLQTLWLCYQ